MKRLKAICINLALAAASLLVCVILCEIALKIAGFGKLEIYASDPHLYWRLKPNQDCFTKVGHRPVHINSKATRGPEFEVPKQAGVVRILSLGDSTTFGWGLSDEETYSRLLEKKLNERLKGQRIEVINAGCNAWGYSQLKTYFSHYGHALQPDYVLIAGANLWTDFNEEASPEFKKAMARRIVLKNLVRRSALYHFLFEREMSGLYNKLRTRFIPIDPAKDKMFTGGTANPMDYFEKGLRDIVLLARTNNVQPVLLTLPADRSVYTNETHENVLVMRRKLATDLKVPALDLANGGWPPPGKSVYLEGDYVHLNAGGNEDVAEKLTELFTKLVRK